MAKSPIAIIYDKDGVAMSVEPDAAFPVNTEGLLIIGKDGSTARAVKTASDGAVQVGDNSGSLTIDATSLPLPTGAATEATLATRAAAAQLPAALVGGRLDENIGAWLGATTPTVGQKPMTQSIPVTIASDQTLSVAVSIGIPAGATTAVRRGYVTLGGGTAGSLQAMRSTAYTEPTSQAQRSLSSSSANDAAAGTGARTVRVAYFNNVGAGPYTETVTLNGTTPVAMVATDVRFIEEMVVLTAGSGGDNDGTITLWGNSTGGGGTIGTIGVGTLVSGVGDNITLWAHHYVPPNTQVALATIVAAAISAGVGTNAVFFMRAQNTQVAGAADLLVSDVIAVIATFTRSLVYPISVFGPARIVLYGVPGVNNATLSGSFDFIEVPA